MGKATSINIRGLRGEKRAAELKGLDLSRILVVAVDTARDFPKALICDYFGKVLEKPFFFTVNFDSITLLHHKIQHWVSCVKAQRIYIGVEAAGNYHKDIVDSLTKLGYQVDIVNGFSTSSQRKKMLDYSKTDDKDLLAICQLVIENDGLSKKRVTGIYERLQLFCRTRREYVNQRSRLKIQIRALMTDIFREFQGLIEPEKRQKVKIFHSFWNDKSRFIMQNFPRPQQILQLDRKKLIQKAKACNINLTQRELKYLFKAARRAVPRNDKRQEFLSRKVQYKLQQLAAAEEEINTVEAEIEEVLVETSAVLLLSIKGVSIITAAEFIGEIGSIHNYTYNRQLIKLAGINPVLSQSGGKEVNSFEISRQGNPHLRYVVGMIGKNLCNRNCRNTYFINYYDRLAKKGKTPLQIHKAAANKFIRIAFAMLKNLTRFHIPGFEDSSSNICLKIDCDKNRHTAQETLYRLTVQPDKYQAVQ